MAFFNWLSSAKRLSQQLNLNHLAIKNRMRSDPYYRLQSLAEVAIAVELGLQIDVNQASVDDWLRLPGISIHQARSLVELVGMGVPLLCIEDVAAAISLPVQNLQSLEPLLYFSYYDPESLDNPPRVNPNTASAAQLEIIPVLETTTAQAIVNHRLTHGKYRNLADLQRRLGLSSQLVSQLMYYLQF